MLKASQKSYPSNEPQQLCNLCFFWSLCFLGVLPTSSCVKRFPVPSASNGCLCHPALNGCLCHPVLNDCPCHPASNDCICHLVSNSCLCHPVLVVTCAILCQTVALAILCQMFARAILCQSVPISCLCQTVARASDGDDNNDADDDGISLFRENTLVTQSMSWSKCHCPQSSGKE